MNTFLPSISIQARSEFSTGRLYVLVHPHPRQALLEITAQLAAIVSVSSYLWVLDGGNWFNAYVVSSRLRQIVNRDTAPSIIPFLDRIQVSRAFTCFQMAAMLEGAAAQAVPNSGPTLVFDLLGSFYDENVKYAERLRLLRCCLPILQLLRSSGPVLVSARTGDPILTNLLIDAADALIQLPAQENKSINRQLSFLKE